MTNENDVTEADRVAMRDYLAERARRSFGSRQAEPYADLLLETLARHRTQAVEAERGRAVAWLRDKFEAIRYGGDGDYQPSGDMYDTIADQIARGDHLAGGGGMPSPPNEPLVIKRATYTPNAPLQE